MRRGGFDDIFIQDLFAGRNLRARGRGGERERERERERANCDRGGERGRRERERKRERERERERERVATGEPESRSKQQMRAIIQYGKLERFVANFHLTTLHLSARCQRGARGRAEASNRCE